MKRIKPDVPVHLVAGVECETSFLLRFFDSRVKHPLESPSYIRNHWRSFIRVSRRKVNEYAGP
jgi:hypothetical protein